MKKKLYRSDENKIFAGIIGGIGEYLDVDPTFLRVIWVLILIFSGVIPGLIVYVIAMFIVPRKPKASYSTPASNTGSSWNPPSPGA